MIRKVPIIVFLALVFSFELIGQEEFTSEDELKVKANELFNESKYVEAAPLFSQLLSLYPKEVEYNFKYGASLIFADKDKSKSLKFLQFATSKSTVDPQAYYFMGLSYHLNYQFSKAIRQYNKFKSRASNSEIQKFDIDRKIQMCENGLSLLTTISEVQVLDKKVVPENNFYRSYKLDGIEGKIISKPKEFISKEDIKQNDNSLIFLPDAAQQVIYPSYGKRNDNGLDLYKVEKLENGEWSEPVALSSNINTPYDENYAFLHPDGKTLYFSSKGHNSMGGYDLFKSTYDFNTGKWGKAENLGFAFSSTSDDILFVSDENNQFAYFASNRSNQSGNLTIYKVLVDSKAPELSVIQGKLTYEGTTNFNKARITVINEQTNQAIGVFETNNSGAYKIEIPSNGGTYKYNLETTNDAPIHTGVIEIPPQEEFKVLAQELRLVGEGSEQKLVIKNIFEGSNATTNNQGEPIVSSTTLANKAELAVNTNESEVSATSPVNLSSKGSNTANTAQIESELLLGDKKVDLAFNRAIDQKLKADEKLAKVKSDGKSEDSPEMNEARSLALQSVVSTQIAQNINEQLNKQKEIYNQLVELEGSLNEQGESSIEIEEKIEKQKMLYENSLSVDEYLAEETTTLKSDVSNLRAKLNREDEKVAALENEKQNIQQKIKDANNRLSAVTSDSEKEKVKAELKRLNDELNDIDLQLSLSSSKKVELKRELIVKESKLNQLTDLVLSFENKNQLNTQKSISDREINELIAGAKTLRDEGLIFSSDLAESSSTTNTGKTDSNSSTDNNNQAITNVSSTKSDEQEFVAETTDLSGIEFQPSKSQLNISGKSSEALSLLKEAASLEQRAKSISNEAYTLKTAEERTAAFEKANELEKQSREKQIEAANNLAEVNNDAYVKNAEKLLMANKYSENFNSANLDMANLMAEEAEVYFSQAREVRYSINSEDRNSKKLIDLQKAYDYEILALEKQSKALSLLEKVDQEYAVNPNNAEPNASVNYNGASEVRMIQTITNAEVLEVRDAKTAEDKAKALLAESQKLDLRADSIKSTIENSNNKELELKYAEVIKESQAKKELADSYFKRKLQIESGFADASKMEKLGAGVNKPMLTEVSIEVDTVNIDESRKNMILNSKDYNNYLREAQKNHRLKKQSQVDYENAKTFQLAQQDFILKAALLRDRALKSSNPEERSRLVKEAEVLESKVNSLQSSIDSVSKIIKLRNYMIQQSDRSLNQVLAWVDDEDRGLLVHLANKNINTDLSATDPLVDLEDVKENDEEDFLQRSDRELVETVITPNNNSKAEAPSSTPEEPEIANDTSVDTELTQSDEGTIKEPTSNVVEQVNSTNEEKDEDQLESTTPEIAEVVDKTEEVEAPAETSAANDNNTERNISTVEKMPRKVNGSVFKQLSPNTSAYNAANPIPKLDKLPEGLVYKVQVGAFRNPIPQDMFKGFSPIMAEETSSGITRYTAGMFLDEQTAIQARDNIRNLGYKDAFVVAFFNGERVGMTRARELEGKPAAEVVNENRTNVNEVNDVFFTVQIGVFSKPLERGTYSRFEPLNVAVLSNGMRRYNSGVYRTAQEAEEAKARINEVIKDAFVTAYYQGKRIMLNEAARLQNR